MIDLLRFGRIGFIFSLIFFYAQTARATSECSDNVVWIRGDFGTARFTVDVADDARERASGLMFRTELLQSAGMLFVYAKPQALTFWMRNTLIELDMLFVDQQGTVQYIHHRARPRDETPISGGRGLTHVLEINGGLSNELGLSTGDQLRHPSFDQTSAAWPC